MCDTQGFQGNYRNEDFGITPINGISDLQKNFFEKTRNFSVSH